MRVFLKPEEWMSLGIKRVAQALQEFAPAGVQIVETPEEAELQIVHMVGNGQRQFWTPDKAQSPFAAIQYCLRTTELPNTKDWVEVWQNAKVVWSYYDLMAKMLEDGVESNGIHFLHMPLGVSPTFQPAQPVRKRFLIGTSGYIADTEGVLECYEACQGQGKNLLHLGPNLNLGPSVVYINGITDSLLAEFWSQCSFVAGLRRIEGFELPVVEGLMCGARPIVFDAPHYTHWFGEFAEIVPEVSRPEVFEAISSIVSKPVRAVSPAERAEVARRFDWKVLAGAFWEAVL